MKINLEKFVENIKRVVNRKTAPLFIGAGLSLTTAANADELYLKAARKYFSNLAPYNEKIQEVSVGNVFGDLNSAGLGYSKSLNEKLDANLEIDANYQKLDAVKESGGVQEVYGSNSKLEARVKPGLKYNIPISKSTNIQVGVSVPINCVYMQSSNEDTSTKSLTPLVEVEPSVVLKQNIGSWFISGGASISKALTTSNDLDTSALQIFINAGKAFGGEE